MWVGSTREWVVLEWLRVGREKNKYTVEWEREAEREEERDSVGGM